ncbi:alpha/beta fold hydrolase [Georgenia thermotolerans]|uniref:Alpha/beta fold hydrolase n=1 Tax=Georgenia thermotolerans TaxID=527326 RepID=A0A7J5UL98_9MICO|nr:alpha/beta hydrolase [Georgenia thermotolerans]KAE8763142.1 alpha/beta fold hydrolase [Georgenia thermotolerans]
MERVTADDGTPLVLERHGDPVPGRPPVVLLTPALADRTDLVALAEALAPSGLTVGYDRRGRGGSGDNADALDGAVARELADLRAVIAAVGGPVVLLGHSSGAILGAVAAAAGLPVAAVVMFEPPFLPHPGARGLPADLPQRLWDLATEGRGDEAVALFQTGAVGLPAEMVAQFRQSPGWGRMTAMARSLAYDTAVTSEHEDPADLAAGLTVPVLVLAGRGTWPELAESARRAAEALGAEHRTVEGDHHALVPAAVAPVVTDFVDRIVAGQLPQRP